MGQDIDLAQFVAETRAKNVREYSSSDRIALDFDPDQLFDVGLGTGFPSGWEIVRVQGDDPIGQGHVVTVTLRPA